MVSETRTRRRREKAETSISILQVVNSGLVLLYTLALVGLGFFVYRYGFLKFYALNHLVIVGGVAILFLSLGLIIAKKAKIFTCLLLLLAIMVSGLGVYTAKTAVDVSQRLNKKAEVQDYQMMVLVKKESSIQKVSELSQLTAPDKNDKENIQSLLSDLTQADIKVDSVPSYIAAYQKLMAGETEAMIFNSGFAEILLDADANYMDKTRVIYTYHASQTVKPTEIDDSQDLVHIYVSGIDTYGPVSSVSRSDVNIIMTINRKTKQVLLTTTPRDAYVAIADGGNNQYDKLTHAGIYGIDASVHTLENLYDIKISYHMRLNFTSFNKLIDLLGGITVDNDQAFEVWGHNFPVGKLHLDSEAALIYVRERYSLEHGDADRGRNQTKVIAGIIDKLTSVEALGNAQGIVSGLEDAVQTNMTLDFINNMVNDQLGSKTKYEVTSQSLEGIGTTGTLISYAMPDSALYMLEVDPDSLAAVKARMQQIAEGE